jgi:ornithine carbamoyltransferase
MATTMTVTPTDLSRVADLNADQLEQLLDLAARTKEHPDRWREALGGETLAMLFEKPSTRTRVSFEAAAHRLGMLPLALRPDEPQLGRGEPIDDTGRVLSAYVAAIVIRTFSQRTVEELAAAASVPVVNARTDEHDPCQALSDLLTLRERFGRLEGLKLAYVGDGNNVANSLIEAGALAGLEVVVASPPGFEPNLSGVEVTTAPGEAVAGAHAVYTDVWVSMGDDARPKWTRIGPPDGFTEIWTRHGSEGEGERRRQALAGYQVNAGLTALARPEAVSLHCLPAHRGEEVTAEVIDGPQSVVWQQAANRLPTAQAALYALIAGEWEDA